MPNKHRLPVSSVHAFALAFDLAVRRDLVHSVVLPLVLQLPWLILLGALPPIEVAGAHLWRVMSLTVLALLAQSFTGLLVMSMLRFRARSVFEAGHDAPPAPVSVCYAQGLGRVPALYVTELVRYVGLVVLVPMLSKNDLLRSLGLIGALLAYIPALYFSFKLSLATEIVVLREMGPIGALKRSFKLTEGWWERWLEMIGISLGVALVLLFLPVLGFVSVPGSNWNSWVAVGMMLLAAILPVVQYAWTFFYLRIEQGDTQIRSARPEHLPPLEGPPLRSGPAPQLRLIELPPEPDGKEDPEKD